jgi:hypothetical protein
MKRNSLLALQAPSCREGSRRRSSAISPASVRAATAPIQAYRRPCSGGSRRARLHRPFDGQQLPSAAFPASYAWARGTWSNYHKTERNARPARSAEQRKHAPRRRPGFFVGQAFGQTGNGAAGARAHLWRSTIRKMPASGPERPTQPAAIRPSVVGSSRKDRPVLRRPRRCPVAPARSVKGGKTSRAREE